MNDTQIINIYNSLDKLEDKQNDHEQNPEAHDR